MNTELEHYKWMRRVVGFITIALPILPILFGFIGKKTCFFELICKRKKQTSNNFCISYDNLNGTAEI